MLAFLLIYAFGKVFVCAVSASPVREPRRRERERRTEEVDNRVQNNDSRLWLSASSRVARKFRT